MSNAPTPADEWLRTYQGVWPYGMPAPKPEPKAFTREELARGVQRYDAETHQHKAIGRLFPQ